ncbi:MAG: phosphocholine cytidylyltransferase family protein [Anaerolineaceae bacterium]|nr:phosphocholine cytidylyltransferase family protein [Anaerolineaceae bacterium]
MAILTFKRALNCRHFSKDREINTLNEYKYNNNRVSTAVLLAAGMGSRLHSLTQSKPKCLAKVNGVSILERLVISLNQHDFTRLVVVTGHLDHCIRDFLGTRFGNIAIEYVHSPLYKTTNNIYSLWMARKHIHEPFMLIESDLVLDKSLLDDMCYPDRIAVARMQPWMNGSTVTLNKFRVVKGFQSKITELSDEIKYKTVNIYSFSLASWKRVSDRLDQFISAGKVNGYYETVFSDMVADGNLSFQAVSFDGKSWYEIDTPGDLAMAEKDAFFSGPIPNKTPYFAQQKPVKVLSVLPIAQSTRV